MNTLKPGNLRCEYVENPIGVQALCPSLSWACRLDRAGGRQTAWEVNAATSTEKLREGVFDKWQTDKVSGGEFCGIPWRGVPLQSAERVYWRVRIWDENDEPSVYSDIVFFEMGLLSPSDWKGRWMSFLGGMIGNGIQLRYPFNLKQRPLRARAYIAGLGYYELRLNGKKIGDKLLDPGATDISKTVLYSAYDVTENLHGGANVAGIVLGTGWSYAPKALLQMNIEYADGSREEVITDWGIGWLVSRGPVTYNSIYDGEDYDARLEKDKWDIPEYTRSDEEHQRPGGWILATIVEGPGGELVGEIMPPVRVTGTFTPQLVKTFPDGRELYDVGTNITGWTRIHVFGERGASVRLDFAETLNGEGDLEKLPLRMARCADVYTLRGDKGVEEYAPRFTYHGFQYFTVEKRGKVTIESMTCEFVRSALPRNCSFCCNNDLFNRMAKVMWHTDACNMFSIPTDCCQRDERHGWTTDTTSRIESCIYHFDAAAFFNKWLRDIYDTQSAEGYFADTAPHRWGRRPCDPQVNTPALLPLLLYHFYGNRQAVENSYEPFKKYVETIMVEAEHLIIGRTSFGEWACPKDECILEPYGAGAVSKSISAAFVSSAYFFYSVSLIVEMASILGKECEAALYRDRAENIRFAFNKAFYHQESGQYEKGCQSANALALSLGLVDPENRARVLANLVAGAREKNTHFSTGNMGTKAMIEALCQAGEDDLVYELMNCRTSPSFGYMLEQGASSMWERWEADRNNNVMNVRNHPMFSSCAVWFYKYLGGIGIEPDTDASRALLIAPHVPRDLSHVEVTMDVPAGKVSSSWKKEPGIFTLAVTIPFNTSARVVLPPPGRLGLREDAPLFVNGQETVPRKNTEGCRWINISAGIYKLIYGGL